MVRTAYITDSGVECETLEEALKLEMQENRREFVKTLLKESGVTRQHDNYTKWLEVSNFVFTFNAIFTKVLNEFEFK